MGVKLQSVNILNRMHIIYYRFVAFSAKQVVADQVKLLREASKGTVKDF
jgi:hypothetical protein